MTPEEWEAFVRRYPDRIVRRTILQGGCVLYRPTSWMMNRAGQSPASRLAGQIGA